MFENGATTRVRHAEPCVIKPGLGKTKLNTAVRRVHKVGAFGASRVLAGGYLT